MSPQRPDLGSRDHGSTTGGKPPSIRSSVETAWTAYAAHHPQAKLTGERRALIERRLAEYDPQTLVAAIEGNHRSAWHRGDNPDGKRYHDLKLILRDGDHIERFAEMASDTPIEQLAAKRNLSAADISRVADELEGGGFSGLIGSGEDHRAAARVLPERADAA